MLKDTLKSQVEGIKPAAITMLDNSIGKYVDRNSEILLAMDLSSRYSFGDNDRKVVYDCLGVTEAEMQEAIKLSKGIYKANKIQSNPFYLASMLVARKLIISKKEDSAKNLMVYMSLMMYTSIHKGSFKYGANKQIMDYTIAHLDKTFLIRQFPSLFAFLVDNSNTAYDTYKDRIQKGDDVDFTWVIDAYWTRIKGKMRKIANAYYDNHKAGNYLNSETDGYGEGEVREMDSTSFAIDRIVTKTYSRLISRQYDRRFIKYSITHSDTSASKLTSLLEDIIDTDDGSVMKLIESMLEFYVQKSGKTVDYVAKGDFIAFMKTAYASNTEVVQMTTIKGIIDKWMDDNMYKYGKANYGKTIKSQYRKSVYMFFVFTINSCART